MVETDRKMIEDGGPAFPHMKAVGHNDYAAGLSLRDWFAGQALAGLIANPNNMLNQTFLTMADDAYKFSDAMLIARKESSNA